MASLTVVMNLAPRRDETGHDSLLQVYCSILPARQELSAASVVFRVRVVARLRRLRGPPRLHAAVVFARIATSGKVALLSTPINGLEAILASAQDTLRVHDGRQEPLASATPAQAGGRAASGA